MNLTLPRRLLALGVLVAAVAGIGSSAAEAKTPSRHIQLQPGSQITIVDDESWPSSDEIETFRLDYVSGNILNYKQPFATNAGYECAGDEVRVDFRQSSQLYDNGWALVTVDAFLKEGTSCWSNDLDGSASLQFWIGPEQVLDKTLKVYNVDEGGDSATLKLKFKNEYFLSSM